MRLGEAVEGQQFEVAEVFMRAQLRGIVGLRLPITRIEGKRKMSQNRSAADRAGVAAGLAASDRPSDRAVAALIPGLTGLAKL